MARILAISSQVARGHVGLSAAVFALQRLGHEVWPLPTVLLSNHPGHAKIAGTRIEPDVLTAMVDALADNGWLAEIDAVLTGYLPSTEHVQVAANTIRRLRAGGKKLLVLVDPVIGDDPTGLYVDVTAAKEIRDTLLPLAGITTPNRFELAWLSGMSVTDTLSATAAAARLSIADVLATSVPAMDAESLANLLLSQSRSSEVTVRRLGKVPHGTGDLLAALYLGHYLNGAAPEQALASAVGGVQAAIEASAGAGELQLSAAPHRWAETKLLLT